MTIDGEMGEGKKKRLGPRLGLMLLLALVPVGLVSLWQTQRLLRDADHSQTLALVAAAEDIGSTEILRIKRAVGAAQALVSSVAAFGEDRARCDEAMETFVRNSADVDSAAFLAVDRGRSCGEVETAVDGSGLTASQLHRLRAGPGIEIGLEGPRGGSGEQMASLLVPSPADSFPSGAVRLTLSSSELSLAGLRRAEQGLISVNLVSADGVLLSSSLAPEEALRNLPPGLAPLRDAHDVPRSLNFQTKDGLERFYTLSEAIPGLVYIVGVWDHGAGVARAGLFARPVVLLPGLAWLVSFGLVLFVVHRLVSRHVRRLGTEMSRYAASRATPSNDVPADMPAEFKEMSDSFRAMVASIQQDEAALRRSLQDKQVLLKEVHHRVKNNLQMISSILSLQIRKTEDPATQFALHRVQERVLGLAIIYRDLYQSEDTGLVNGGDVIREIIDHAHLSRDAAEREIALDLRIDDIPLFPDQAVPLSLLVAEAITNAVKYVSAPPEETPEIHVRFERSGKTSCLLEIRNSLDATPPPQGTGLGAQLINGFAMQLGGEAKTETAQGSYLVALQFDLIGIKQAAATESAPQGEANPATA